MTYSEKDLQMELIAPIRWTYCNQVNLATVRKVLQEQADKNGIPVAFSTAQLKVGDLFSRKREDILEIFPSQEKNNDLRILARLQQIGKYSVLRVYIGNSDTETAYALGLIEEVHIANPAQAQLFFLKCEIRRKQLGTLRGWFETLPAIFEALPANNPNNI